MTQKPPSPDYVEEFATTLSERYRNSFETESIAQHAAVAAGRGSRVVNVGRFSSNRRYGNGICVVAEDRPGLLAAIGAGLAMHQLDVIHGEAHTRTTTAKNREAVDLFWIRGTLTSEGPEWLSDDVIAALQRTLIEILTGQRKPQATLGQPQGPRVSETRVLFLEGSHGELSVLEVEAADRPGLLMALAGALHAQQVQIVSSEVHTESGQARDRFALQEIDGKKIGDQRRLAIQVAILSAIEQ